MYGWGRDVVVGVGYWWRRWGVVGVKVMVGKGYRDVGWKVRE